MLVTGRSARQVVRVLAVLSCMAGVLWWAPQLATWQPQPQADETTGSAGARTPSRGPLVLTDEQRHRVYQGLMPFPEATGEPALDVADEVPSGAPLQDLPAALTAEIPLLRGQKFIKLDDRILLVEAGSRTVAAMIPRYRLLP